jgi:hypothetical protein
VHATFSLKELATTYDTLEKLRAAPELARYLRWIARQQFTRQFRRHRASRRK